MRVFVENAGGGGRGAVHAIALVAVLPFWALVLSRLRVAGNLEHVEGVPFKASETHVSVVGEIAGFAAGRALV